MKPWLLKLHRWITLVFAAPLAVVILTGLVLSFEPSLTIFSADSRSLTSEKLIGWLNEHDEEGVARSITHRSPAGTLTIGMEDEDDDVIISTATGQELETEGTSTTIFSMARRLHETLLLDMGWLVISSTFAMLALITLGLFMGLPRLRNSLSGWHKGAAWFALPLVIASPLTGLFMAYGISFSGNAPSAPVSSPAPTLAQAVQLLAAKHDLSSLVSLRPRGKGAMTARIFVDGEYRNLVVTAENIVATERNWPRLIHSGNWAGHWSAGLNIITSLVIMGLMVTGLMIWLRRKLRMRGRNVEKQGITLASS